MAAGATHHGPAALPAPDDSTIAKAVRRLDRTLPAHDVQVGSGLEDASIVIAFRDWGSGYTGPCGLWLTDRRRIGHVETNTHDRWRPGVLADDEGAVLAQVTRPKLASSRRSCDDLAMVNEDLRELATFNYRWIRITGQAETWSWRGRHWWIDELGLFDGDRLLADGRATEGSAWWSPLPSAELTTAIWLHPELDLDQRAVVVLAVLRRLGPPRAPPD